MNSTLVDRLNEFYDSPSADWFSIYTACVTLFSMLGNGFFIILTLSSKTLRKTTANWFLVGLAVADFLHSSAQHAGAWAIMTGSIENRSTCVLAGFLVLTAGTCMFGFPAFIAANRYYIITAELNDDRWSCADLIFSDRMILPLIVLWFIFSFMLNIPLVVNKAFGEDLQIGICAAKPFTSVTMLMYYEVSMVAVFFLSIVIAAVCYYSLAKYLNLHYNAITRTAAARETINYTEAVMRVMKFVLIVPMITSAPVVVLNAGQMVLPTLPLWVGRVFMAPHFWSSCANPWLSIALIRSFRMRFLSLFRVCATTVDPVINVNMPVIGLPGSVRRGFLPPLNRSEGGTISDRPLGF